MITGVTIKGYKCLQDVTVDGLTPFTVCIGPNDSGKSSFLQALAVPSWGASTLPQSLELRDGLHRAAIARGSSQIAVDHLKVNIADRTAEAFARFVTSEPIRMDSAAVGEPSNPGTGDLASVIRGRGHGISAHIARLALTDRRLLNQIVESFQRVTGGRVADIVTQDFPHNNSMLFSLGFRMWDGSTLPASELSQGLLLYLAYLCVVHRSDVPSVLLIEEPENGLHPHRLRELTELLRTFSAQGKQVILTTHSPDLLSFCEPEEVLVFQRPNKDSGTQISRIEHFEKRSVLDASLGEVWASGGEDALLHGPKPALATVSVDGE